MDAVSAVFSLARVARRLCGSARARGRRGLLSPPRLVRSPCRNDPRGRRTARHRGARGGRTLAPHACLIGRHRERDPAFFGARSFSSLSNYYTLRDAPVVDGSDGAGALVRLIKGLRERRPRYAVLHFEPLAADAALSDDLAAALRHAGLVTRRYFRFGNRYDDTRGLPRHRTWQRVVRVGGRHRHRGQSILRRRLRGGCFFMSRSFSSRGGLRSSISAC